jgi:tRNA-splicing ligase RtcB
MSEEQKKPLVLTPVSEAVAQLQSRNPHGKPITVIGTPAIRDGLEPYCLEQALNAASGPGVTEVVINPDAHQGYGAPIGCVLVSPTHIYPGPVGVDVKCSMSLVQFDLPVREIASKKIRRELIDAVTERIPTGAGMGQRSVRKSRRIQNDDACRAVIEGASPAVCEALGIPVEWAGRCEDAFHVGHDGSTEALAARLETVREQDVFKNFSEKLRQLGSYGGGNHFGECEAVEIVESEKNAATAATFGLKNDCVAFFSHCGSRGFGNVLATNQFRVLRRHFEKHGIPLPAGDRDLVYAELGTPEADAYLDDMALGANFASVNHLLINALVLEAFQEVIPGIKSEFVYFISHNIARKEVLDGKDVWVHRKGATRAFPAGHPGLVGTRFEKTGHPILLPGNPVGGSAVMVAEPGARLSCFSVNHGAGRQMGRKAAIRQLDQKQVDQEFNDTDILTNCRFYPKDEAPAAYKDFNEVVRSVETAGLARTIARMKARFVVKDSSGADD